MNFAHLFEAAMLVCFGFSWPLNVRKAYKARTAKGTSLAFICLIITGYVAGISAKFINHQFNYVLAVYFLNLAIVSLNVFVYIRNRGLDKKRAQEKNVQLKFVPVEEEKVSQEEKLTELQTAVSFEEQNAVILLGSGFDKEIPVENLGKAFDFNFDIYNKSEEQLSVMKVFDYYKEKIEKLNPEALLIHLGENDLADFKNNSSDFDNAYLKFIDEVKSVRYNTRIALVSIRNPDHDRTIAEMNSHIKAVADAEHCTFINLENAKLWNPEATKASSDFAYSMGVRTRKPLKNVAEILYSYAEKEMPQPVNTESYAG